MQIKLDKVAIAYGEANVTLRNVLGQLMATSETKLPVDNDQYYLTVSIPLTAAQHSSLLPSVPGIVS